MSLKLIGRKKNLEVYRDPNYFFPNSKTAVINKEKQQIHIGPKILNCRCSLDSVRVLQVKKDTWIVIFKDTIAGVNTSSGNYWEVNYKDFHIIKDGIYIVESKEWGYISFDLESFNYDIWMVYDKEKCDVVTFYKKFVIVRRKYYSDIFVNTDDLPDFDINFDYCITSYELGKNKILVHFKDISKKIKLDKLLYFASELINNQISSSKEIYLDIEYSNFKEENNEVLDYLKSPLIYNCEILDDIF